MWCGFRLVSDRALSTVDSLVIQQVAGTSMRHIAKDSSNRLRFISISTERSEDFDRVSECEVQSMRPPSDVTALLSHSLVAARYTVNISGSQPTYLQ